jgi:hypothetical protein
LQKQSSYSSLFIYLYFLFLIFFFIYVFTCSNIYIFIRSLVYVVAFFAVSSFGVLQVGCLSPTPLFVSILTFFERGKDFSMVFSFQFIFSRLLNAISFSFINKYDSIENIYLILLSFLSPTFSSEQLTFHHTDIA